MGEGHILGDDDLLAGLLCGFHLERGFALDIAPLAALGAQRLQCTHAAFIAGTPRLDALANPHFFLSQLLVEQRIGRFLSRQLLLLVHQEARVVAIPVDQVAAVQFEDTGRQVLQECPVVGDEQHGTVETGKRLFQPGNRADIQVVGGLVEQQ